jgi:serine/threonine protein kinase
MIFHNCHAGIVGVASIVVILVLFKLLFEEKRKTKEFFIKNGGPILEKVNNIKIFKKEELKAIIEPCNVIGKGGFGEVYKGLLDNQLVAIKKSINVDRSQEKQFANEIIIQSRVIHKNIVKLIGCCLEVDVPMLVYEFVPQGSLHDILHNPNNNVSLNLGTRLNIAAGAAEGLSYMHSKTTTTIFHGDIKPSNILLDDNFDPKISDFGISRLIAIDKSHTKCVVGDMCYMDPIYLQSGLLTKKSDVYSFGVVLLELLSRKKATFGEDITLVKAFLDYYSEDKQVLEVFDKEILVEKDIGVLHQLAMLIVECLELDVDRRPEMTDVAERLHSLNRSHKNLYDENISVGT